MPLGNTQKKVGHLSETSKNPTKTTGRPLPKGQSRVGHLSETSRPTSDGGKREVPGYRKGDEYNTGEVGSARVGSVKRAGDLVGRSGRIEGP
jgi:hypothetical protein